jgi:hypothetical protein
MEKWGPCNKSLYWFVVFTPCPGWHSDMRRTRMMTMTTSMIVLLCLCQRRGCANIFWLEFAMTWIVTFDWKIGFAESFLNDTEFSLKKSHF